MKKLVLAATVVAALMSAPAHALRFNLIDTGGTAAGTQARTGFNIAAQYWASVLTDDVTVNLEIGFRPLGANILGQAGSTTGARLVQNGYADLFFDASTNTDVQAVTNLQALSPSATFGPPILALDAVTSAYVNEATRFGVNTAATRFDNDGSANNVVLDVNTANLKALGVFVDDNGDDVSNLVDGEITFSSTFAFDFNATNGIAGNSFDFVAVAIHEIGHVLGFVSGVDIYDLVGRSNGPLVGPFEAGAFGTTDIGNFRLHSMLDLFRYSGAGVIDWSVGGNPYFSLDGGASELFGASKFSTGQFNGNGSQASHWIDNPRAPRINPNCTNNTAPPIGIMNPTIGACELGVVTALDLAAFDSIGWDLNFDALANSGYRFTSADAYASFVPEPGSWAMMITGFGLVGGAVRRRRSGFATA